MYALNNVIAHYYSQILFRKISARAPAILNIRVRIRMNECLTTHRHEKQIGYWVSEKGKCMKLLCQDSSQIQVYQFMVRF